MAFVEQNILKLCMSGIIDKFYFLEAKALRVYYWVLISPHCSFSATLTEVFPYFFLNCKANARVRV